MRRINIRESYGLSDDLRVENLEPEVRDYQQTMRSQFVKFCRANGIEPTELSDSGFESFLHSVNVQMKRNSGLFSVQFRDKSGEFHTVKIVFVSETVAEREERWRSGLKTAGFYNKPSGVITLFIDISLDGGELLWDSDLSDLYGVLQHELTHGVVWGNRSNRFTIGQGVCVLLREWKSFYESGGIDYALYQFGNVVMRGLYFYDWNERNAFVGGGANVSSTADLLDSVYYELLSYSNQVSEDVYQWLRRWVDRYLMSDYEMPSTFNRLLKMIGRSRRKFISKYRRRVESERFYRPADNSGVVDDIEDSNFGGIDFGSL